MGGEDCINDTVLDEFEHIKLMNWHLKEDPVQLSGKKKERKGKMINEASDQNSMD